MKTVATGLQPGTATPATTSTSFAANDKAETRVIFFALVTIGACSLDGAGVAGSGFKHSLLFALALAAISVAIWHGAYDGVLARILMKPRLTRWWVPIFGLGYLAIACFVLVCWHFFPQGALAAFLLYSSWHFGTERLVKSLSPPLALTAFSVGSLPVLAACHWHPDQVIAIFRIMLGAAPSSVFAERLTRVCASALWLFVGIAVVGTLLGFLGSLRVTRIATLCVVALELILFRSSSPIIAFAVYFCTWHTPEHLVSTSLDLRGRFSPPILLRNLRAGLLPWMASLAALAVLFAYKSQTITGYASAVFILLSALTVPHMALNEFGRNRWPTEV